MSAGWQAFLGAVTGALAAGVLGIVGVLLDRSRARRHELEDRLRAAVVTLTTTAVTTPFSVMAARSANDAEGAIQAMASGLDRLVEAHGTIALLGDPPLRAASDAVLDVTQHLVFSNSKAASAWERWRGVHTGPQEETYDELANAIQRLRDAMKDRA